MGPGLNMLKLISLKILAAIREESISALALRVGIGARDRQISAVAHRALAF